MKILWICPFMPYPLTFGGNIRTFNLMKEMAKYHTIDLACLGPEKTVPELTSLCRETRFFPLKYRRRTAQLLALMLGKPYFQLQYHAPELNQWLAEHAQNYDAVVVEMTQMSWIKIPSGPKTILNMHNIESEVLRRTAAGDPKKLRALYRTLESWKLSAGERQQIKGFDQLLVCSDREKKTLEEWGIPGELTTVPNGVDNQFFEKASQSRDESYPEIVFIGSSHYYPNEEAILFFQREIWPTISALRPESTFGAVGGNPKPEIKALDSEKFRILGRVDDIRPYFHNARLLVVPLLSGGGTRLKILEAASAQTPIVSTSIGAEGLRFEDQEHILKADSASDFAQACLAVFDNPEQSRQRVQKAWRRACDEYDWKAIAKRFHLSLENSMLTGV